MRRGISIGLAVACLSAFGTSAPAAAIPKPQCVVVRINLAAVQGVRTVINGWDNCSYRGRWLAVGWFVDPNGVSCRRDVGGYGPANTRKTYMAYIAYDACAVVVQGYRVPWVLVHWALATESRVSARLMITYQPG